VDDDDALAQRFHVGHVVAGQEHRRAVAPVVLGDERTDPLLHRHVEADRRLVEEEHLRLVQQGGDDPDLHPLAEREIAHRLADEIPDLEQVDQLVAHREIVGAVEPVDRAVQLEGVECRNVPLQLVPVPHHHRHPPEVLALATRGHMAEHARLTARRIEQAREHLQRRRLACAVWAKEPDHLTGGDLERDGVDGADVPRLAADEALNRRTQAGLALGHLEDLRKLGDVDD
jgi:hypothetical protein